MCILTGILFIIFVIYEWLVVFNGYDKRLNFLYHLGWSIVAHYMLWYMNTICFDIWTTFYGKVQVNNN